MQATLSLQNFSIDHDTKITVAVHLPNNEHVGEIRYDFAKDANEVIEVAFSNEACLGHLSVATIIFEASKMIDSHFDSDAEAYSEKTIEL